MRVAALLASAALIAAPAYAQNTDSQLELRGAYSGTTITVGQADEVGGAAVAGGNALSRSGEDVDVQMTSVQHMDGDANAQADASIGYANVAVITSAAVGNGATATSVNGDIDADITQFEHGNANAETRLRTGDVGTAASSSSSAANVAAVSAENGEIRGNITQESTGSIHAGAEADHGHVYGQVVSDAVASANNVAIAGATTTLLSNTNQSANGASVTASVDLYANSAADAVGNATANANAVTIDNAWGYLNATARQAATTDVRADSAVTLSQDFDGFASASAYGVGNSTIASNLASDTALDVVQENEGAVDANAALSGGGGDQALASSAAYGNVVTGSLCAYCDSSSPGLEANTSQYNDGAVTSTATVNSSRARQVAASSSAIGNAATYQVTGPR
jgi:hypothetical protein